MTSAVILLLFICVFYIYKTLYVPLKKWKNKDVAHETPWIFLGNMVPVVFKNVALAERLWELYNKFSDKRYYGFYQFSMPTLVIRDPQLIRTICVTEFDKFMNRTDLIPAKSDPFWKKILFARTGSDWKELRKIVGPIFSTKSLKETYQYINKYSRLNTNHLLEKHGDVEFDARDFFKRFNNDVTANYVFGVNCDSIKDRSNEFYLISQYSFAFKGIKYFKFLGYSLSPLLMSLLRVTMFDQKTQNYYKNLVHANIEYRDKFKIQRKDLLYYLREAYKGDRLNHEDLTAQSIGFFFGNYETGASTICNACYELALNPAVQDKLLEEIDMLWEKYNGDFTYDSLNEATYLNMVISEALRLRSTVLFLNRSCVKGYTIEPVLPGEKPLHVEPGTDITIPLYSLFKDPKLYPNPEVFDPERFSTENKHKIDKFAYLPFGVGPRSCIANRLVLLQVKSLLLHLLGHYKIVVSEKTGIPFTISSRYIHLENYKGYWFRLEKRKRKTI